MKLISILFVFSLISISAYSQEKNVVADLSTTEQSKLDSVSKLKTANSQDFLTNIYRASLDSILGKTHSFTFNSTFHGWDSLFKAKIQKQDTAKSKATTIYTYKDLNKYLLGQKFLYQNSSNLTLKGDSNNNLTNLSLGFTFTLLNHRDLKYHAIKYLSSLQKALYNYASVRDSIKVYILHTRTDIKALNDFDVDMNNAKYINDFTKLSDSSKVIIIEYSKKAILTKKQKDILDGLIKGIDLPHNYFSETATEYSRKPLLTFSPAITYDVIKKQPTYSFGLDFLIGLNQKDTKHSSWEAEAKLSYKIMNDTLIKTSNLNNKPFVGSIGINKVLLQDVNKQSTMELKIYGEYDYQFEKDINGNNAHTFTFNSTFRIKVLKSLWLPITAKYDPRGSLFGFISITADFGN